jgi:hypothetical protein
LLKGVAGWKDNYGTDGYAVLIDRNSSVAKSQFEELKNKEWIGRDTRAVLVSANLYNLNMGTLSTIRVLAQFYQSGFVKVNYWMILSFHVAFYKL